MQGHVGLSFRQESGGAESPAAIERSPYGWEMRGGDWVRKAAGG